MAPARGIFLLVLFLGVSASATDKHRRLIAIGGGTVPLAALTQLAEWAGGAETRALVVTWATESDERDVCRSVGRRLRQAGVKKYRCSPSRATLVARKKVFLQQLEQASAIYFTGGDQQRLMKAMNDADLAQAIAKRYASGLVVAGTSAGAAILSKTMLTGEGDFDVIDPKSVGTEKGLGLLTDAIVDQHFLARKRLNRLLSVLSASHEATGIGIDEATALAIEDEQWATVLGSGKVVVLSAGETDRFTLDVLPPLTRFDLVTRQRTPGYYVDY